MNGEGPLSLAWWIGRVCEEFGLTPSAAYSEWINAPEGLIEDVIEARMYSRTKAAIDSATDRQSQPAGRLADLCREIDFALAQEEIDAATD